MQLHLHVPAVQQEVAVCSVALCITQPAVLVTRVRLAWPMAAILCCKCASVGAGNACRASRACGAKTGRTGHQTSRETARGNRAAVGKSGLTGQGRGHYTQAQHTRKMEKEVARSWLAVDRWYTRGGICTVRLAPGQLLPWSGAGC